MKLLLTVLFLYMQTTRAYTDEIDLSAACSKFDYEYKVLRKLVALEQEMDNLKKELTRKSSEENEEAIRRQKSGSLYTRWGRNECQANGTELVYKGYVGGSHYTHKGGAANHICLPETPTWGVYDDTMTVTGAYVYGGEYEMLYREFNNLYKVQDHDESCAVCRSDRPTSLMIPGRTSCIDSSWTLEYAGYLAAGHVGHDAPSEYVCLDSDSTGIADTSNKNGVLFYLAEVRCGSLPCDPYVNGRELACVVCTK